MCTFQHQEEKNIIRRRDTPRVANILPEKSLAEGDLQFYLS
jgi:hypothetical protein